MSSADPEKEAETPSPAGTLTIDDSTPPISHDETLVGFKLYTTLFSVMLVGYLITLDASIVVTAIPRITAEFHSIADIGWYGSAYLISNCACQLSTGKIYQHYPQKTTFLFFLSIFEIGSVICGAAQSSIMLIIGRSIAGLGGSGLMNGGYTIVAKVSPREKRPLYLGMVMGVIMLGLVSGPLLGGVITQDASWRWCFYINLPIGGVGATVILFTRLPNSAVTTRLSFVKSIQRLDPVGFLTFAPFCIMLLLALQWGGTNYPWNSATVIGLLCGSIATLGVFIAWEHHCGDTAMMPTSLLRKRIIYSSCIVSTFQMGGTQIFAYYLPVWFQVIKHASPSMSGVYFTGMIGPQIIFAILSGALVSRLGYYTPWAIGGNAISAIGSGLLSMLKVSSGPGPYIGYQILCGVGRGTSIQQPITAVQASTPPNQIPVGTALVVFTQFFGGAIFVAFAQTAFTNSLGPALQKFAPGVNAEYLINVGATSLRNSVQANELEGVLMAYNQALIHTFYLAAGASSAAFLASWGMGWVNLKKPKQVEPAV